MNVAQRLSMWMQAVGAGVDGIEEELLVRFVAAERSRDRPCASVDSWIGALRRFLTAAGYLRTAQVDASQFTPAQAAVAEWCAWMRSQRGLTEKSIAAYCYYGAGLLDAVTATDGSVQWGQLDASIVNAYVTDRGRPYGVVARARIVGSVRCLLRWALSTGRLDRDLTAGILKPPGTKRSVPRGVAAAQVAALLAVCDPATAIGARDRALVLMLVRLGLRAGGVAAAMAKLAASEAASFALDAAIQTHGGNGMAREYGLATLSGLVRLFRIAPVSSEMLLNHIAHKALHLPRSYQ
jgi:alkylation response protein AidB-like acyl-CoA dehydrogenase